MRRVVSVWMLVALVMSWFVWMPSVVGDPGGRTWSDGSYVYVGYDDGVMDNNTYYSALGCDVYLNSTAPINDTYSLQVIADGSVANPNLKILIDAGDYHDYYGDNVKVKVKPVENNGTVRVSLFYDLPSHSISWVVFNSSNMSMAVVDMADFNGPYVNFSYFTGVYSLNETYCIEWSNITQGVANATADVKISNDTYAEDIQDVHMNGWTAVNYISGYGFYGEIENQSMNLLVDDYTAGIAVDLDNIDYLISGGHLIGNCTLINDGSILQNGSQPVSVYVTYGETQLNTTTVLVTGNYTTGDNVSYDFGNYTNDTWFWFKFNTSTDYNDSSSFDETEWEGPVPLGASVVSFTEYNGQNGHLLKQSSTWSVARESASTIIQTELNSGANYGSGWYFCKRSFVFFDTSSIPTEAAITAVSLEYTVSSQSQGSTYRIYVDPTFVRPGATLDVGDWGGPTASYYSTAVTGIFTINSLATYNTSFTTLTVNRDGLTGYCIREYAHDVLNVAPPSNFYAVVAAEDAVKLWVTYSSNPGGSTQPATYIEETTATLNGYLSDTGGASCECGFQYSTSPTYATYTYTENTTLSAPGTFSKAISGLTPGQLYYFRASMTSQGQNIKGENETFLTKPNPPAGVAITDLGNSIIRISWTNGTGHNTTRIMRKTTGFPSSPTDSSATLVVNSTSNFHDVNVSTWGAFYLKLWSFAAWAGDSWYSDNGTETTWGMLLIGVFNESKPTQAVANWDIFITNLDGTSVYNATGCNNYKIVNTSDVPSGEIQVIINATGYQQRVYYMTVNASTFYGLNAYLVPKTISGEKTLLCAVTVLSPALYPVQEALVNIKHFINTTGIFENVTSLYTDGAGMVQFYAKSNDSYKIIITKDGYETLIADWIPSPLIYTKTFQLKYETPEHTDYYFNEEIHTSGYLDNTTSILYVNYTDDMSQTLNISILVFEINSSNASNTLIYSWSDTSNHSFQLDQSVMNKTNDFQVVFYLNHTEFGAQTWSFIIQGYNLGHGETLTSMTTFNSLFAVNFGYNPFGWSNTIMWILLIGCFFAFDKRKNTYMTMFIVGFFILFVNYYIGFNTTFSLFAGGAIPVLIIIFGILMLIRDRKSYIGG